MQVGFLMALAGIPVRELFDIIGYWWRTRVHVLVNGLRAHKRVIVEKHQR